MPNGQSTIVCVGAAHGLRTLILVALWALGVGTCVLGAVGVMNGETGAWLLIGVGALVFIPIAAGLTGVLRKADAQRITVLMDEGEMRFENVYLLSSFLPRPATFECRVTELEGVYLTRGRAMEWLYVFTPRGRVALNSFAGNYHQLRAFLLEAAPRARVPLSARGWFPAVVAFVIVMAVFAIGVLTGWLP